MRLWWIVMCFVSDSSLRVFMRIFTPWPQPMSRPWPQLSGWWDRIKVSQTGLRWMTEGPKSQSKNPCFYLWSFTDLSDTNLLFWQIPLIIVKSCCCGTSHLDTRHPEFVWFLKSACNLKKHKRWVRPVLLYDIDLRSFYTSAMFSTVNTKTVFERFSLTLDLV